MRRRTTWLITGLACLASGALLPLHRAAAQAEPPDPEVAADEADPDDPAAVGNPAAEDAEEDGAAAVDEADEPDDQDESQDEAADDDEVDVATDDEEAAADAGDADEAADEDDPNAEAEFAAEETVQQFEAAQFMAEDWAPPPPDDDSNDPIPTDTSIDPSGLPWEVVEVQSATATASPGKPAPAGKPGARPATGRVGDQTGSTGVPIVRRAPPGAKPSTIGAKDTPYSYGGRPVPPGATPWQAQIYMANAKPVGDETLWQAQHDCGGVLIAPEWVLTAAHCVFDIIKYKDGDWRIRLGVRDLSAEQGTTYAIDRWVVNSRYSKAVVPDPPPNMYANDIALVHIKADAKTRSPANGVRIEPIQIYRSRVSDLAEVTAIGWGKTEQKPGSYSAITLKVDLSVMPQKLCMSRPGYGAERINDTVMCAARARASTCRGDSGGPVILGSQRPAQLVALVSWGKGDCTGDGQPSVFTRVESHLAWIDGAMKVDPSRGTYP